MRAQADLNWSRKLTQNDYSSVLSRVLVLSIQHVLSMTSVNCGLVGLPDYVNHMHVSNDQAPPIIPLGTFS